jgi:hypothetical protein
MSPENYPVISFDKLLNKLFPNLNAFIPSETIREVRELLKQKYDSDVICIKQNGVLKSFDFKELKYYQTRVGINGPQHTKLDEPVYVVHYKGENILLNGYHRTLIYLIDSSTINAYYLSVD